MDIQLALVGKRVLVVEDDYLIATDLKTQLHNVGINVIGPVPNIGAAQELLSNEADIAGAILDVRLGDEFVFPVADELERRGVPFVFATGFEPDIVPARHSDKIVLRKPTESRAIAVALAGAAYPFPVTSHQAAQNLILARLPPPVLAALLPQLRVVALPRGSVLEVPDQLVNRVYFPLDCVASMIVVGRDGTRVETGIIGREGLTGSGLSDNDDRTPYELIIQIDGTALAMSADEFRQALTSVPELRVLTTRFARSLGVQVSYTALANAKFDIRQRLARWLVMMQDRVPGRSLNITHDYLAVMLGVRRSSVTDVLHILEGDKLIRANRSCIKVRNRNGLIEVAGESYGAPEAEHNRLTLGVAGIGGSEAVQQASQERNHR
ncbi:Crp/Fnr family transcriptional regulator [Agrobacterium pusense]|uniref:helix-turn-helix domain-containing protein n=1 Tax=Agrobacterium pusense TaxID=648995 RepID=UPI0010BE25AD|nr:helix-turn-helix domain-containing protein [Agrobacterium pusense]MDH0118033.1 helix-turn-helix domain-containing protein [Agrobacterium pusense]QCL86621.1 Crp/Fnr family transcriptional regulator [Agrobacterium pusense]